MEALDDKEYSGSLLTLLQDGEKFVKNNTKKRWKKAPDGRMEVYSPGGMLDGSFVQNLDTDHVPSRRRNPVIADVFSRINYMERRGSGFRKIKDDYRRAVNYRPELEPKFYSDTTSFWVTLYNLNYHVAIDRIGTKKASEYDHKKENHAAT